MHTLALGALASDATPIFTVEDPVKTPNSVASWYLS
jgi:hypothetical protein